MGRDGLDGPSIKMAAAHLYKPLMFIINLSIKERKFCNKLKLSKVLPLHKGKGKPKLSPESYRPICILRLFQACGDDGKAPTSQVYMEESRQWNYNNQAYRANLNTTTTLLTLSDTIFQASEDREIATAIAIDESAAFDCISFKILTDKMKLYNFDDNTIKWFDSYLRNRTQYVVLGRKESKMIHIKQGVAQGSVLGPMLYTLYINEMCDVINDHRLCEDDVHRDRENLLDDDCRKMW